MNRPMFQTPQMREGSGIMAGVAPINMDEGGFLDSLSDMVEEYNPFPDFLTTEKGGEGELTIRDITDFLIADPDNPTDVAIAAAMAPLWIFPPAAIAARLARMGYKGAKVTKALEKVTDIQKKAPKLLGQGTGRMAGYAQSGMGRTIPAVGDAAKDAIDAIIPEAVAEDEGGISSLPEIEDLPEGIIQTLPYKPEDGDFGIDIDEEGNITFTPGGDIPELTQPFMRYDDEEAEGIMEMLPRPSPTKETPSEGIQALIVDEDEDEDEDRLSRKTGWFPGKRILRSIRELGDDERWLAADGGLATPQNFAVGGIARLTSKYGPEISAMLKKVADQFGENSNQFKAVLKGLTGDAQTKTMPKLTAETLGISSKATKKQREAAAKLKKEKDKAEAKAKKAEAKKAKQEEPLPPVEPEVKPGMMAAMGRNKLRTAGGALGAGALGLGAYSLYEGIFGDDEEAPAEEVVEEKMTVTEQVDEPRQWREIFSNLGELPGEFRDTIVNSMDRIKEDPVYRRAMLSAFRAMTTPREGYVPFNTLSEAVNAYYGEMDAIEARKSEFDLTKEALAEAYPEMSEQELIKMALGRSKSDFVKNQLSLFYKDNPGINPFEDSIAINPEDDNSEKVSQYDLIVQSASQLEKKGLI